MNRKLVTKGVPAKGQHETPCSDCPWARTAMPGWLGSNSKEQWVQYAHGETQIECHVFHGAQCAGAAIYRANVGKVPRDRAQLRLPPNKQKVFTSPPEFLEHHSKTISDAPWISVNEQLPSANTDVLFIALFHNDTTPAICYGYKDDDDPESRLWYDRTTTDRDGEFMDVYTVILWMPVPAIPQRLLKGTANGKT